MAIFQKLRTYSEMTRVIDAFAETDSRLGFVIVKGNPGLGKTATFTKACGGDAFVLDGQTTPFGLYCELYRHKDAQILVLDDVDSLLATPAGINLMKTLCQTEKVKRVSWNTNAAVKAGIPTSFVVSARILLFCNTLKGKGKNFAAVMDRGHCYHFAPTAIEVHKQVQGWMLRNEMRGRICPEVVAFVEANLERVVRPTFRDYVKGSELKAAGLDWQTALKAGWERDPKLSGAAEIVRLYLAGDATLATAEQRAARFQKWGYGCRATYMAYQSKVMRMRGWSRLPNSEASSATAK